MKKAKIYYSNKFGRNDGAPLFIFEALKRRKDLEVEHLWAEGDISKFGGADYHFFVDWGEDGLPVDPLWMPPEDGGKKIYIVSDTHLGRDFRFKKAQMMDYVFFNQKRAVDEYENRGQIVSWLPHAVEPLAYPKINIIPKYDVCFVGHLQTETNYNGLNRIDFLDKMFAAYPNFYYGSRNPADPAHNLFEDAARKFSLSKIALNISIKDDINMRVFETLATQSFLLTNWLPTFEGVFGKDFEGKYFATYKTMDEAITKADYYLKHDGQRDKIAKAGYDEVIAHHTYDKRLETIFNVINL